MTDICPYHHRGDGSRGRDKNRAEIELEREEKQAAEHYEQKRNEHLAREAERKLEPEPDFPGDER